MKNLGLKVGLPTLQAAYQRTKGSENYFSLFLFYTINMIVFLSQMKLDQLFSVQGTGLQRDKKHIFVILIEFSEGFCDYLILVVILAMLSFPACDYLVQKKLYSQLQQLLHLHPPPYTKMPCHQWQGSDFTEQPTCKQMTWLSLLAKLTEQYSERCVMGMVYKKDQNFKIT